MQKIQAQNIVRETLQNDFDKERFLYFIKNLLNKVDESKAFHARGYVPEAYKGYVKTYERLATYTDPEGSKVDIIIVYLQKETSLERARTAQRNFIARYLKDRDQKDAGLIAFVSPDPADWRFSLVKMEYKFTEGKSGKTKVVEEFTPAKRWSFLVGNNENSHTAQSRLAPIIEEDQINPTLKQLEDAFNIEKVTKEFFDKYRELFLRVYETLSDVIKKHPDIKADFAEKNVNTVDFSKKLLGQIVFLYFLQKKGWFGVPMNKSWGDGDKKFLRTLFDDAASKDKNYFNDFLEPLFYEALAKERDDDFYSRFECKIPFLNGGLFDPISNYDWVNTAIDLPNDIFSNTRKTKEGDIGNGILDIFDRYNFTVKEDEPLEKEVAVDPEMLGKVFENLLEVKDRKSKGTYYTPREIVHYMCEQSLVNYLATELENKVSKEDLEKLIKIGENLIEHEAVSVSKEDNPDYGGDYKRLLPDAIKKFANEIDEKLATIKVCDPAIGSGAFPVGMMNAIVKARLVLTSYIKDKNRTAYNFKRDCIQNSLYGVDIDPGAVEIAKLRLWLSLIVDEEDIKQIKPLPNLDYKIMQGNSLLEDLVIGDTVIEFNLDDFVKVDRRTKEMKNLFEKEVQAKLFKDKSEDVFAELRKLHSIYFEENNKSKKLLLKQRIDEKQDLFITTKCEEEIHRLETVKNNTLDSKKIKYFDQQIINIRSTLRSLKRESAKPFFLWKLHFADVFQEKGGFDVIVANPPYIDSEAMTKNGQVEIRETIQKTYKWTKGNWDIYIAFFELGFREMNQNGTLTFITPDKWISKPFGNEFRKETINNIFLILKAGRKIFDNAKVDSIVSFFTNRTVDYIKIVNLEEENFILKREINKASLLPPFAFDHLFSDSLGLLLKIDNSEDKLSKFCNCENACATSDAYKLEPLVRDLRGEKYNQKKDFQIINTGTIGKFYSKWGKREMTYLKHKYLFPVVDKEKFLHQFSNSYGKKSLLPKIIIKGLNLLDGCLDEAGSVIPGKTTLIITDSNIKKLKFLLAIINSNLAFYYIKEKYPASSYNQGTSFTKDMINNLPIPKTTEEERDKFIKVIEKIITITESGDYYENKQKQAKVSDLEHQIDELVYKLYGLNEDEIKIVKNS